MLHVRRIPADPWGRPQAGWTSAFHPGDRPTSGMGKPSHRGERVTLLSKDSQKSPHPWVRRVRVACILRRLWHKHVLRDAGTLIRMSTTIHKIIGALREQMWQETYLVSASPSNNLDGDISILHRQVLLQQMRSRRIVKGMKLVVFVTGEDERLRPNLTRGCNNDSPEVGDNLSWHSSNHLEMAQ